MNRSSSDCMGIWDIYIYMKTKFNFGKPSTTGRAPSAFSRLKNAKFVESGIKKCQPSWQPWHALYGYIYIGIINAFVFFA